MSRAMNGHEAVRMIDCHEVEQRLHLFLDRELSSQEVAEVQGHLDRCDNCRARFSFESGLRRLVAKAGRREVAPASLRERIRRQIHGRTE